MVHSLAWRTGRRRRPRPAGARCAGGSCAPPASSSPRAASGPPRWPRSPPAPASPPGRCTATSRRRRTSSRRSSAPPPSTRSTRCAPRPRRAASPARRVEVFARRALAGRRMAWALIAEPVDPAVEAERLVFRRRLRGRLRRARLTGAPRPRPRRPPPWWARSAEALVGPLSPDEHPDEDALVGGLVAFVTDRHPGAPPCRCLSTPPPTSSP